MAAVRQQAAVSRSWVHAQARPAHIAASATQRPARMRAAPTDRSFWGSFDIWQALAEPQLQGKTCGASGRLHRRRCQEMMRLWPLRSIAADKRAMASRSWLRSSLAVARTGAATPQNIIRASIDPF